MEAVIGLRRGAWPQAVEALEGEEGRRSMLRLINRVDSRFQKITLISVLVASVLAWFIHLA